MKSEQTIFEVKTSQQGWDLLRLLENEKIISGFPTLVKPYTVQVLSKDSEKANLIYQQFIS